MKFDVVVGNPPYQIEAGGTSTSDDPIYNHFYDLAENLADKYILISPARFLFNAGKTPKIWNLKMLNDEHVKVVYYEQDSEKIFPHTDIKGGVSVIYRNNDIVFSKIELFVPFKELKSIITKVKDKKEKYLDSIIYTQNKFKLEILYKDYPNYVKILGNNGKDRRFDKPIFSRLDVFTENMDEEVSFKILGRFENKRVWRYIPQKYVEKHDNLNLWKVILPVSNGKGKLGEKLSTPIIAGPGIGYTRSFISIGAFETKFEASSVLKYIKTKFARVMLGILKITQDNTTEKWRKVPIQDFSEFSDIDWTKSISNIDAQLYTKYGLSKDEIAFIEEKAESMD